MLVVGAYGMSRHLDWTDKYTCTLFADGAGAVVLGSSQRPGWLSSQLWADGFGDSGRLDFSGTLIQVGLAVDFF